MEEISMHILDMLQNSLRAKSSCIQLGISEDALSDTLTLEFIDNGCGMDESTLSKALSPFFTTRTTRKIGLGLPLLKQQTELTGGFLEMQSKLGEGTKIKAVFGLSHWDRQPIGNLSSTLVLTISAHPEIRFIFSYKSQTIDFFFDTKELEEILGGVSLQHPALISELEAWIDAHLEGRVE